LSPLEGVGGILLDIEGTTTPISFVYDVLFPYTRERLDDACARAENDPAVVKSVADLRAEHLAETENDLPAFGNGAPYARWLMGRDRKSTGLKTLQGLIWENGYGSGELRGEVFDDVPPALTRWRKRGARLRIFSSGSVLAQKLLFAHTRHGDLTPYFEGFHDTTTGPKKEAASYTEIARAYGVPPGEILFLSDVVDELDAAARTGMRTALVLRPGNRPADPGPHVTLRSFDDLP
jgi:enolase-phosphatase E1